MHFVLADHFSERDADFSGAHRSPERDEHLAATIEVPCVALCGVPQGTRIEVPKMGIDEGGDR